MCLSSSVYSDGTSAVMNDTDDSSSAVASVKHTPALELKHRHWVDQRYPRAAGLSMSTESDDVVTFPYCDLEPVLRAPS